MARRPSVLSLVDIAGRMVLAELDLRPGDGVPGGEYPEWAAVQGNSTAFVSSARDREIRKAGPSL